MERKSRPGSIIRLECVGEKATLRREREARAMRPKDEVREWLDTRCGRPVQVETHLGIATEGPTVSSGPLTKHHVSHPDADASDRSAPVVDLYEVGTVSYNLADLPEDIKVHIEADSAERLEMTFDDGTSMLITVVITVTE